MQLQFTAAAARFCSTKPFAACQEERERVFECPHAILQNPAYHSFQQSMLQLPVWLPDLPLLVRSRLASLNWPQYCPIFRFGLGYVVVCLSSADSVATTSNSDITLRVQ